MGSATSISRGSRSSCSTRRTACSTWASFPDVKRVLALLPEAAPEPAVLGHVFRRDQGARRQAAEPAADDRSHAAQLHRRRDRATRASGEPRGEEQVCWRGWSVTTAGARCSSSRAPSTAPTSSCARSRATASARWRCTATRARIARTRALADFKAGAVEVLVATDIAARGIDIDQLPHVVNYDLPNVPARLRPSHRPHRTRRRRRRGDLAGVRRRARFPARYRAPDQAHDPARSDPRLRARPERNPAEDIRATRPRTRTGHRVGLSARAKGARTATAPAVSQAISFRAAPPRC